VGLPFFLFVIFRSDVGLIPESGESFLGTDSLIGWKTTVSTILYPIKIVLVGPMFPLINLPDPPPPFLVVGFALYWTILALVIYYVISKIKRSQQKLIFSGSEYSAIFFRNLESAKNVRHIIGWIRN